jgi:hypothetical protein
VTIVDAEELAGAMTEQLASLFAEESAKDTGAAVCGAPDDFAHGVFRQTL